MEEISSLLAVRRKKLDQLRELGVNPYANDFRVEHTFDQINTKYADATLEALEGSKDSYTVAGRVMAVRSFGKAAFLALQDRTGKLQVFVQKNSIGDESFTVFKLMDLGDIIGITGTPFRTKTGELTLHATSFRLLTKSLHPLPEKWHGLTDTETRYRQRYVDLIVNPKVAQIFRTRAAIIQGIRDYLNQRAFLEVETPMLHPIAGGAAARPFTTHHNTLDMDLFLRIAPELHLKRLLVGGLERVYEINRNFRNEGISIKHNPEFTMLEFYWAYATYEDLIQLTENLIGGIAKSIIGDYKISYQGQTLDFTPPWRRMTPAQAIAEHTDFTVEKLSTREGLMEAAKTFHIDKAESMPDGKLIMEIFETVAEDKLIQPTFLVDFPIEVSPLARKKESNPALTDRFELYVAGREIANAFSELNDPIDQKERFEAQLKAREAGDDEAHVMDEDYVRALEFGMPPAAGEGIGIDRLTMLFTDSASIREVILFPLLRHQQNP